MPDDLIARLLDPEWRGPMQHLRAWSELDAIMDEAAAALAAKDAEIERLRTALGSWSATLMGMQDGSLVRDQAAEIERLRADHKASVDELFGSLGVATAALTAIHTALGCGPHLDDALGAVATLRARLAKAEAALRVFSDAAEDLDDRAVGAIWECPEALLIECDDLRKARAYFAALDATTETPNA